MENTFWNTNRDGNFVTLFKKSLTLFVESGKMEAVIDILKNVHDGWMVANSEDFKETFSMFIIKHRLRKFHCFYLHSTHLMPKYSPSCGSSF